MSVRQRILGAIDSTGPRPQAYFERIHGAEGKRVVLALLKAGILERAGAKRGRVVRRPKAAKVG